MTRTGMLLVATAAVFGMVATPAFAGSKVTSLKDELSASPDHYMGHCPGVITFHGKLTVKGIFPGGQPVEIGYQFTRSDGATSQNKYFNATHDGVYDITETWTLGGAQLPHFTGWEKFKAWPTDSAQNGTGTTFSNEARFTLECHPG